MCTNSPDIQANTGPRASHDIQTNTGPRASVHLGEVLDVLAVPSVPLKA